MTGEVNVAKRIRGAVAPSNGARRQLSKAMAESAGRMFEALLALDVDDDIDLHAFSFVHLPTWEDPVPLRSLVADAARLVDLIRQDVIAGESTRIDKALREFRTGTGEARARVVDHVKAFAELQATHDGPDHDDHRDFIAGLASCAPEFARLKPADVWRLLKQTTPKARHPLTLINCVAALALEVGAFGSRLEGDEKTNPDAYRRVAKAFDLAVKRRAIATSPARKPR